jgi:methionine-rich copper-binding protein CopC
MVVRGLLAALLIGIGPAWAADMQVMESRPAAQAVMTGSDTQFFVRFDGPVDHGASSLTVLQGGKVVQTLHPRLNSQPNVLYSGIRRLPSGSYVLHWEARSTADKSISQGDIPFSVAQQRPRG